MIAVAKELQKLIGFKCSLSENIFFLCVLDIKWKMFTFVKSAANYWKRREMIRRTWGSVKFIDEAQFTTIFVIGKSQETTQALVDEESDRFGDIIQINSSDDYL